MTPRATVRGSTATAVGTLVATLAVGAAATLLPLPYAVISPGPSADVLGSTTRPDGTRVERIAINGAPTYPTSGSLDFTTVLVSGGPGAPVHAVDVLTAWAHPHRDVVSADALFPPDVTREQVAEENRAEMTTSQQTAVAVAVRAAGHPVPTVVAVARVPSDAPAAGVLREGDVVANIEGSRVTDPASVRAALQRVPAGQAADLAVERDGALTPLRSPTGAAPDGRTILGVTLRVDYRLPFEVTIDAGAVGGPSAGLMFSLGVFDKLTPGPLTGGQAIAGTGTIDDAGAVGRIDGIRQKLVGARAAGARHFLAPGGNCADADDPPQELSVVRVDSFEQAREAVEAIGRGNSDALPRC